MVLCEFHQRKPQRNSDSRLFIAGRLGIRNIIKELIAEKAPAKSEKV